VGFYSRISIVCGAIAIFSTCLSLKNWKASRVTNFLSKFSFGIFAVHKYWQLVATVLILNTLQKLKFSTEAFVLDISAIGIALATIFLTFGSILLLNKPPFQRFIR
jgi:peptidoglycan/LPS O-acetylase OafA/YrhL